MPIILYTVQSAFLSLRLMYLVMYCPHVGVNMQLDRQNTLYVLNMISDVTHPLAILLSVFRMAFNTFKLLIFPIFIDDIYCP
jgi:hypothetical protein